VTALRLGSLFAGIGGFDLGFERAGFETAWQVENSPACNRVLAERWPGVSRFGDVLAVGGHELAPVDVITFGSPCQDLSVAGKGAGFDGARSGLFFEAVRIIKDLRPAIAIWENVPGALGSTKGADFGRALDILADAGAVDICWRVLDAQWLGVAQRRRRVFVVADFGGHRAAQVLLEPEGSGGHSAAGRETGEGIAHTLTCRSYLGGSPERGDQPLVVNSAPGETAHTLTSSYAKSADRAGKNGAGPINLVVAHTLTAGTAASPGINRPGRRREDDDNLVVTHTLRAEGHDASEDGAGRGTPPVAYDTTQITSKANRSRPEPGAPCHSLAASGGAPLLAFNYKASAGSQSIVRAGDYAGTVRTDRPDAVAGHFGVRRLTPTECERLQGFPDGWTLPAGSDSARYHALGNAVCVNVAEWIARRLVRAILG